MNVLDLFSGIGGFSLGLERAGMRTIAFCEKDPYCQAVLKKHWPHVPCHDDIKRLAEDVADAKGEGTERKSVGRGQGDSERTLGGRSVDLVCGGFPCQPFSVAGKRRGAADDRHLWPEMFRIIEGLKPRWVLGENVPGLLKLGLDQVLSDLEGAGYSARTFHIPACAVDAPHRRQRLWIVANTNGEQVGRPSKPWEEYRRWEPEPGVGRVAHGLSLELDFARQITGWCNEQGDNSEAKPARNLVVKRLLRAVWEHREIAAASPDLYVAALHRALPEVPLRDSPGRWLLGPRIEKDQRLRDLWAAFYAEPLDEAQDMQFRLLDRAWENKRRETLGNRVDRLRALGNAVVPQVVEKIGRAIMELENAGKLEERAAESKG